jgi:hypothetical protein
MQHAARPQTNLPASVSELDGLVLVVARRERLPLVGGVGDGHVPCKGGAGREDDLALDNQLLCVLERGHLTGREHLVEPGNLRSAVGAQAATYAFLMGAGVRLWNQTLLPALP